MKGHLLALAIGLVMCAPVHAAMLGFDVQPSQFLYDHNTQMMTAHGVVTVSDVGVGVVGLPFNLSAVLSSVSASVISATFAGVPGFDLEVPGQLNGEIVNLSLFGVEGADFGVLVGQMDLAGLLAPLFGQQGALFSLQLNMSELLSAALFRDVSFTAQLNGSLTATVPAPTSGILVAAMLLLGASGAFRGLRAGVC